MLYSYKFSRKFYNITYTFILNCFQFFTASPCFLRPNQLLEKILIVWAFIQYITTVIACYYIYIYRDLILPGKNTVTRLNSSGQLFSIVAGILVIIPNGIFTRKKLQLFWKSLPQFRNLDEIQSFEKQFVQKVFLCTFIIVTGEIFVGVISYKFDQWQNYWLCTLLMSLIGRLKQFQFIFYVNIIQLHLCKLITMFDTMISLTVVRESIPRRHLFKYSSRISKYFRSIWFSVHILNDCFGLPELIFLIQNFIIIAFDLYWLIFAATSDVTVNGVLLIVSCKYTYILFFI